jgi:IS30 family transposase
MKRINSDDRMLIQACLTANMSISEIARRIRKHKSSVSREISSHIEIHEGYTQKTCIHEKEYVVCNGCQNRYTCLHRKRFYNFENAQNASESMLRNSRSQSRLSQSEKKLINSILIEQIRNLKQSLHHVYESNPALKRICSERTIRRAIYRGDFDVKAHELRKYVVYKHEYTKTNKSQLRDLTVIIGRRYIDFINFVNKHKRMNIVQYDSVIGKITDEKAILTITFPKYGFQFGLLINKSNPKSVVRKIKDLFKKIGIEKVKEIFPINLADNGVEFSYFNKIEEFNGEFACKTFFTNPYKATDKAQCERYHEFIRYMIPKGKSLDFLTQEKVNWMFSQINSYVRKSQKDRTPYELVERKFGKDFLDAIGIYKVQKKKVALMQLC